LMPFVVWRRKEDFGKWKRKWDWIWRRCAREKETRTLRKRQLSHHHSWRIKETSDKTMKQKPSLKKLAQKWTRQTTSSCVGKWQALHTQLTPDSLSMPSLLLAASRKKELFLVDNWQYVRVAQQKWTSSDSFWLSCGLVGLLLVEWAIWLFRCGFERWHYTTGRNSNLVTFSRSCSSSSSWFWE
jgi:hypothetical protein